MSKRRQCTVLKTAAGPCSLCRTYVADGLHAYGPSDGDGPLRVFCAACCPECGEKVESDFRAPDAPPDPEEPGAQRDLAGPAS